MKSARLAWLVIPLAAAPYLSCSSSSSSAGGADAGFGPGDAGLTLLGWVTASQATVGRTTVEALVAGFAVTSTPGDAGACSGGQMVGTCCYQPGPATSDGGSDADAEGDAGIPVVVPLSAGTINISGPAGTLATLVPGNLGIYPSATVAWSPGDALFVSATGDVTGVGNFVGTLRTVAPFAGVSPPLTNPIVRSAPFTVTWTPDAVPGDYELVSLSLVFLSGAHLDGSILCNTADSLGTVTVQPPLLGQVDMADVVSVTLTRTLAAQAVASTVLDAEVTVALTGFTSTGAQTTLQ